VSMVDDISVYLQALGYGTLATDLFKRYMPDDPSALLCVVQSEGEDAEFVQNSTSIEIENPRLILWSRADAPEVAEANINGPYEELSSIRNQVINGTRYLSVRPTHAPVISDRDGNGRFIARCDFVVRKELSSGT
jgi:hypothetical protein